MDRLAAVGDPSLRSTLAFVRGSERAVTADELAAHDVIHRNVARSRLERLAAAGLDDVCAGMRGLGFQAIREDDVIVTPNCPLRPLVAAQPQLAAVDKGMWAGLVGGRATCTIAGCLDMTAPCRIQVLIESRR